MHSALALEATHRSTHKIDGVRSNYTRPALGAPLRDKHCGDSSHTARQRHPEHVHNEQDTSSTSCGASQSNTRPALLVRYAGLPLRLLETWDQQVSLGVTAPQNACPSDATSAHTFFQKAKSDPRSRWSNRHCCRRSNLDPLPQRSLNLCVCIFLPVLWLWSVATAKRIIHGKPGIIRPAAQSHGRTEATRSNNSIPKPPSKHQGS